ncbi:DUF4328 domain-containing protein [Kitasatospora sp. NPDC001664]
MTNETDRPTDQQHAPSPDLRPVADPRRLALWAQGLIAAACLVELLLAVAGGTGTWLFRAASLPYGAVTLAAAVLFLRWLSRVRHNAEHLAPDAHRYAPAWAVGAWFVPFMMWWAPRRIVLDVDRASGGAGTLLVNLWWVAWLGKTVGMLIARQLAPDLPVYTPAGEAVNLLAGALAVLLIHRITAAQCARFTSSTAAVEGSGERVDA